MNRPMEIPQFLIEMSKQIREQDNRITAEPIWQVRYKRYIVTEKGYNESHFEVIGEEGETLYDSRDHKTISALAEHLHELFNEWCVNWLVEEKDLCDEYGYSEFITEFCGQFAPHEDMCELPDNLKILHMQKTEEVVKSCLTEVDAKYFIECKQHDYPKLYTYVESMTYCPQMIELRNWILSLTENGPAV